MPEAGTKESGQGRAGQEKETGGQNQKRFVYDRFSFNLQCMLFVWGAKLVVSFAWVVCETCLFFSLVRLFVGLFV